MKALVILSHPNLEESIANKTIINRLSKDLTNIEIRHIEELYPQLKIDVNAEQEALLSADIIVFQHPFYWYSTPAGLKQWMDSVLSYGFAFGHDGDKLKGKYFIESLTIGGPTESYSALGYNHFSIEDFLRPIEQTAYLTMMNYQGFVHSHRNAYIAGAYNSRREVEANGEEHAYKLINKINALRLGSKYKIQSFIDGWFAAFDDLDENSFFTQYLAEDIQMNMLDSPTIRNHEDFNQWYDEAKQAFETPTKHLVSHLEISPTDEKGYYKVEFNVHLEARLVADQSLFTVDVKEKWLIFWDAVSDRPLIKKYDVTLLNDEVSK